jgi:hypothetical protein
MFDTFVESTAPEFRAEPPAFSAPSNDLNATSATPATGFETLIDMTAHFGEN